MEQNYVALKDRRLNHIILPGTHNSAIDRINYSIPLGNKTYNNLRKLAKYVKPIGNFIYKWTVNQYFTIEEQLKTGVRLFDLRVTYIEREDKFYLSHTFMSIELCNVLEQIVKFMGENQKEVIMLKFSYDYEYKNNSNFHTIKFMDILYKYLDKLVFTKNDTISMSDILPYYSEMVEKNKRIILLHDYLDYHNFEIFWTNKYVRSKWLNVNNVIDFEKNMYIEMKQIARNNVNINLLQFILTPQISDIKNDLLNPFSDESLDTMASKLKNYAIPKIFDNHVDDIPKISGIFVDYIDVDVIRYIITLNHVS